MGELTRRGVTFGGRGVAQLRAFAFGSHRRHACVLLLSFVSRSLAGHTIKIGGK